MEEVKYLNVYLQCAFGFHARILTDQEFVLISSTLDKTGLSILPYEEVASSFTKYDCFVSFMRLGEPEMGNAKAISFSDIKQLQKQYELTIFQNMKKFEKILDDLNLQHLTFKLELMIYIPH